VKSARGLFGDVIRGRALRRRASCSAGVRRNHARTKIDPVIRRDGTARDLGESAHRSDRRDTMPQPPASNRAPSDDSQEVGNVLIDEAVKFHPRREIHPAIVP